MLVKKKKKAGKLDKEREKNKILLEKEDTEFLDNLSEKTEYVFLKKTKAILFIFAVVTALVPTYLYQSVIDLKFQGYSLWILLLLIAIFCTCQLYSGYCTSFMKNRKSFVVKMHIDLEDSRLETEEKGRLVEIKSLGATLWFANCVFIVLVLILGFYVLREWDSRINLVISLVVSAFLTRAVVSREKPERKGKRERLFP